MLTPRIPTKVAGASFRAATAPFLADLAFKFSRLLIVRSIVQEAVKGVDRPCFLAFSALHDREVHPRLQHRWIVLKHPPPQTLRFLVTVLLRLYQCQIARGERVIGIGLESLVVFGGRLLGLAIDLFQKPDFGMKVMVPCRSAFRVLGAAQQLQRARSRAPITPCSHLCIGQPEFTVACPDPAHCFQFTGCSFGQRGLANALFDPVICYLFVRNVVGWRSGHVARCAVPILRMMLFCKPCAVVTLQTALTIESNSFLCWG